MTVMQYRRNWILKGLVEVYRSEFENIEYGSAKKITVKIKETADKMIQCRLNWCA